MNPSLFSPTYLRLREVERGGELHPLRRGEVPLGLEAALQAAQLRVGEHGSGGRGREKDVEGRVARCTGCDQKRAGSGKLLLKLQLKM